MTVLRGVRISTLLFAGVLVYFAVHAFVGQQGLLSWRAYVERADRLTTQRDELVAKREALEAKVARLHGAKPDADYLEERAFSQLRMVDPQDFVIALPDASLPMPSTATASDASMQTPNP